MSVRTCVQCEAKTKNGTRCKRRTCVRGQYCFQHLASVLGLEVKQSQIPGGGRGLYTLKAVPKGRAVVEYTGERRTPQEFERDPSLYGIALTKSKIIDARSTQSSVGRYANDCRTKNKKAKQCKGNNTKFAGDIRKQKVRLRATRKIKPGEEVFVSYGRSYWK
jgi:SET domain-containing protein